MPPEGKKELNQVGVGGIKSLRTFQGDVAEALGQNNVTVAKIAIAENARKAGDEVKQEGPAPQIIKNNPVIQHSSNSKRVILFLFSLILLSGGIFGGLYFYSKSPLANVTPQAPIKGVYRGILSSNMQKKVVLGTLVDKRLEDVLAYEKTAAKLEQGQTSELYFVKGDGTVLITSEEFLNLSTTRAPDTVRRSLLDRFMFGYHRNSASIEPYLVLKTEFFQNTFTGMLKWEPEILSDTAVWLSDKKTSSLFEDEILKNKDIRVLKDASGNIAIMYGFLDKETLLITTNQETFLEILDRFEKQAYIR